jgi:hypothetical protein
LWAAVLAILGTVVGIIINSRRGDNGPPQPHMEIETARAVPPAEMPGIGYLPEGTDSVIAVELRPLLEATSQAEANDARSGLRRIGIPDSVMAALDRAVGVGIDNVDQLVLGLKLKDGSPLNQVVLVVHARQSFSIKSVAERMKALSIARGERTYYRLPATSALPSELLWWAPNDRVLVAALLMEHLDAIPSVKRDGLAHLAPRAAKIIGTELANDSYAWAVLDSEHWDFLSMFIPGTDARKVARPLPESLSLLRTAVLAVRFEPKPMMTARLDFKVESAAESWRRWLTNGLERHEEVAIRAEGNRVMLTAPAAALVKIVRDGLLAAPK